MLEEMYNHLLRIKEIVNDPSKFLFGTETIGVKHFGAISETGKACQPSHSKAIKFTLRGAVIKTSESLQQVSQMMTILETAAMEIEVDENLRNPQSHLTALRVIHQAEKNFSEATSILARAMVE